MVKTKFKRAVSLVMAAVSFVIVVINGMKIKI